MESETAVQAGVILADPPWRYDFSRDTADAIERHYATMDLPSICALPVARLAAKDYILFLWTTAPKLSEAMDVVRSWGFVYRTCAIWHKSGLGMGHYFRIDHELLLVAVKGTPGTPPTGARVRSVVRANKRRHSQKPWQFHSIIERMYPEAVKLELFCRTPQPGWHSWGLEATPNLFNGPILPLEVLDQP